MRFAAVLLLVAAVSVGAQDRDDDRHRADRLRTEALNTRSPNGYAGAPGTAGTTSDRDAYEDARADYRKRLAAWRRRVAACEAGYYDACDR